MSMLQVTKQLSIPLFDLITIRSCTAILRIIHTTPKRGKMLPSQLLLEGSRHGVASFFLSARPDRTHLAFHHFAPPLATARGDGSGRASPARAAQAQAPPLHRAQTV